jgi:dTDP-4-dehydrorhamnose reductase
MIKGERIYLRELEEEDATEEYLSWLNDPQIKKYLETPETNQVSQLVDYIKSHKENKNSFLTGIFDKKNDMHLGNIKLEPIDWEKKEAMIGILIGNKAYWKRGIGIESVNLLVGYAFRELKLDRITLGVIPYNDRAIKCYEHVGFKFKERIPNCLRHDGKDYDNIIMELTKEEWEKPVVLIAGASGLLGSNLAMDYSSEYRVIASYYQNKIDIEGCSCLKLDFTSEVVLGVKPNVIINCIALTNVDECERDPKKARLVNVETTKNIVKLAKRCSSYLVHISTDSVFDGKKGKYKETSRTNPINVYADTKLESEKIAKGTCIVRTNIYGWNLLDKMSLAEWILDNLENGKEMNGFTDVYFTPILVNNLGLVIRKLIEKRYKGVLHVAGSQRTSKYNFAVKIAEVFGLDKKLIKKWSVDDFEFDARRPKSVDLDVGKAEKLLKTKIFNVKEGLLEFKRLRDSGYVEKLKGGKA